MLELDVRGAFSEHMRGALPELLVRGVFSVLVVCGAFSEHVRGAFSELVVCGAYSELVVRGAFIVLDVRCVFFVPVVCDAYCCARRVFCTCCTLCVF